MTGHPVRLTLAALAILGLSATAASAGCYGCGYAPPCCAAAPAYEPPAVYKTVVVYPRPMYIVDQGPSFNAPVYGHVNRALDEGQYTRVVRWHRHHHHWHHAWRHHGCTGCALGW